MKPDHLIVRYLSNEATPVEQEQLFDWVSRSPENQKVFNEYISLWSSQRNSADRFDLYKGLRNLNSRIDEFEAIKKKRTVFWSTWNVAAAVVLLAVAGVALYYNGIFTFREHTQSLLSEAKAGYEVVSLTLTDGSRVTLNKGASLKYPEAFSFDKREVYLTGEAFFQVTKNSRKPFIVHANGITTKVLGTSFNVNALPDSVVVSVATGKVEVSDGTRAEVVRPYERVLYAAKVLRKEETNLAELNWNTRVLEFNNVSMAVAAEELSTYYEVPVMFQDEKLKKCLITGKFKNQKLETVLRAIEFSTDVHAKLVNDTVLFFGKGRQ
jgi:transmembrane sensor